MIIVKILSLIFQLAFTFLYCFEAYERVTNNKTSFYYTDILFCIIIIINLFIQNIFIILLSLFSSLGLLLYFVIKDLHNFKSLSSYHHQMLLKDYLKLLL